MILDQVDDIFYALSWDDDLTSWQEMIQMTESFIINDDVINWFICSIV